MSEKPQAPAATPQQVSARQASRIAAQIRISELTDDQDELMLDPKTLDPNMHYRWGHERSLRQSKLKGPRYRYRPVSRSQDKVRTFNDSEQGSSEDLIRNGDLILMCCPKEAKYQRDERSSLIKRVRLGSPVSKFKDKAAQGGIPVTTREEDRKEPGE